MKKFILILGFVLPLFGFSQKLSTDFKVSTAAPFKVVDANSKEYVYTGDKYIISVKTDGDKVVVIQKFDIDGMKEVGRKEYEDLPEYTRVQSLLEVKDKLYYIFEALNKKEDTHTVYCREIDKEKGIFKPQIELFTTKKEVVAPRKKEIMSMFSIGGFQLPRFEIKPSFDESKILVHYRNKPVKKNDSKNHDELGFYVFDSNLEKIWGRDVLMPHTEEEIDNLAYAVNNEGTVFMIDRLNETKSIELITITKDDLKNKKLAIKDGLIFNDFNLKLNPAGNIVAAGYYANGVDVKVNWTGRIATSLNVNGLLVFEFNKEGEIINENDIVFPIELIKQNLSERGAKKAESREEDGNAGIGDLTMREFEINPDGSIIIIGEVYYTREELWLYKMDYVTHFGDLVITKINADGSLAWIDKLPKNQASLMADRNNVDGLGVAYIQGGDSDYLLFIDNRDNAELAIDEPAAAHKGGYGGFLTAYKIDKASGEVEKHLILDLKDIGGIEAHQFKVTRIMEAGEGVFLMEVYIKGKEDTMVKMEMI